MEQEKKEEKERNRVKQRSIEPCPCLGGKVMRKMAYSIKVLVVMNIKKRSLLFVMFNILYTPSTQHTINFV